MIIKNEKSIIYTRIAISMYINIHNEQLLTG